METKIIDKLDSFLSEIQNLETLSSSELIEFFVYFLVVIEKKGYVQPHEVKKCFKTSKIAEYSNISSYLSKNTIRKKGRKQKFVKSSKGYSLERTRLIEIKEKLSSTPQKVQTSQLLSNLLSNISDSKERSFLKEAIDCYHIKAKRGAIVLIWILVIHHLYRYILKHKLVAFNQTLAKNTDKRIKIKSIKYIDDFSEIPEGKFIEFCRASNIISNDVRKILEIKIGIRNSAAHPSGITLSDVKVTDFIIDLIENIVVKYKL